MGFTIMTAILGAAGYLLNIGTRFVALYDEEDRYSMLWMACVLTLGAFFALAAGCLLYYGSKG